MKELYPFQLEATYQVNSLLNASRSPVFLSPTGTGKTVTVSRVIKDRVSLGRRIFLLAPTIETYNQWVLELIDCGLNPGTINSDGMLGRNRDIYVCMYMSLFNILPYVNEKLYPDEICIDELHHFRTDTVEAIKEFFPNAVWFGCTATLSRLDGKGFDFYFTDIVQTITMKDAIDQGFLARPLVIVPERYHQQFDVPNPDSKKGIDEQVEKLGKTEIVGDVIKTYGEIFAGLPVIVACCSFEHSKMMTEMFCDAGWDFRHIHGNLPERERTKMINDTRAGRLNGLCTYAVGSEGVDIVGLYGVLWLRRTTSLIVWMQFCGRCLRRMKGKKYGIIVDFVGNLYLHSFPEADRVWTLTGTGNNDTQNDTPATMRICPFCGVANAITNIECHFCGAEIIIDGEMVKASSRHFPAMVDGELIAVQSDGQAESLKARANRINAESKERMELVEKEKEIVPVILTNDIRSSILRTGLFSGVERRPLFNDAIKGLK